MNPSPTPLKHVIIGVGAGVLNMHHAALELPTCKVVGVADINAEVAKTRAEAFGCAAYSDHRQMLAETKPDVAIIIAPHPFHAALAIDAVEAGAHVLVEKPIAVQVAEADAMVEAAQRTGRLLAVNFQQRTRADVRTAYKLIQEGRLGHIQHVDMTLAWPRTTSYFKAVSWRGTWKGEGGGVLMNQAPHNLDLLCHLLGAPSRLVAWTRTTLHSIETEDTVQAMLEWASGTLGTVHISTAEAKRPERLELIGTRGNLRFEGGRIVLSELEQDMAEHIRTNEGAYSSPAAHEVEVVLEAGSGNHVAIYQNLHDAILTGTPLIADGASARMSLELANAMIYSSHSHQEVSLPLDREAYRVLLEDLKAKQAAA